MPTATSLNQTLQGFIETQKVFFVATADIAGRVNLSPKGMDTLKVCDRSRIRWLNLTGSGNETAAHVRATGRMTLMFCAFEGSPMIIRAYGKATVIHPRDNTWSSWSADFPNYAGARQIFELNIDLVQISCGTGVPKMNYVGDRGTSELLPFYEEMGPEGVRDYWGRRNAITIDSRPTGIIEEP